MLAAGDVHGLRAAIRDAVRAGDNDVAQEYLTVGASKLSKEFGDKEVRQLRNAAMTRGDAERAAIHKGLQTIADDDGLYGDLGRHVDTAVERAGAGDPYDGPDPSLGKGVTLWSERMEQTATDSGVKAAEQQQADSAAVLD